MSTSNLNISIDDDLKNKAQAVLLYSHEIPLESLKKVSVEKKDRRAAFGCLKGKIHVPDNFNEPLDDFMEYMQ